MDVPSEGNNNGVWVTQNPYTKPESKMKDKLEKLSTEIELALYDLERLGYWQESAEAEYRWSNLEPWFPAPDVDLPTSVRSEIGSLNAAMQ